MRSRSDRMTRPPGLWDWKKTWILLEAEPTVDGHNKWNNKNKEIIKSQANYNQYTTYLLHSLSLHIPMLNRLNWDVDCIPLHAGLDVMWGCIKTAILALNAHTTHPLRKHIDGNLETSVVIVKTNYLLFEEVKRWCNWIMSDDDNLISSSWSGWLSSSIYTIQVSISIMPYMIQQRKYRWVTFDNVWNTSCLNGMS